MFDLPTYAQTPDLSTPEKTIQAFLDAINKSDLKQAVTLVEGAKVTPDIEELNKGFKIKPPGFKSHNLKVMIDGDTATATFDVIDPAPSKTSLTGDSVVMLRKVGVNWLIVPPIGNNYAVGEKPDMMTALVGMLSKPEVARQTLEAKRSHDKSVACLSNVKQVAFAICLYLQDHDESYPTKPDTLRKTILPYLKRQNVWHCPAMNDDTLTYTYNSRLQGVSINALENPNATVLFYEGKNEKLDFRHNGFACVAFADGSARRINAQMAKKLRWKP